jgi:hypothetical protein
MDEFNRRILDTEPDELRPYHIDPKIMGAQVAHLWKAYSDSRDMLTSLKTTVVGMDGNNGLKSRVAAIETLAETRIVRLHARIDAMDERVALVEKNSPTFAEMQTAIQQAITQSSAATELAIERALKKYADGNWATWAQLITSVGTFITLIAAIAKMYAP